MLLCPQSGIENFFLRDQIKEKTVDIIENKGIIPYDPKYFLQKVSVSFVTRPQRK